MNATQYQESRERMKQFAKKCILEANTVTAMNRDNPNFGPPFHHPLDPESWNIIRIHANKILKALEEGAYLDPSWVDAIEAECKGGDA